MSGDEVPPTETFAVKDSKHQKRVDIDKILKTNRSPDEVAQVAGADLTDETTDVNVMKSDGLKRIKDMIKNKKPAKKPRVSDELAPSLSALSGSILQMSQQTSQELKEKLDVTVKGLVIPGGESRSEVTKWAMEKEKKLTLAQERALATAMAESGVPVEEFETFLLAWNMRGDHNVVEVKNIMEGFKSMITDVLAALREFRSSYNSILTGIKDAMGKITTSATKAFQYQAPTISAAPASAYSVKPSSSKTVGFKAPNLSAYTVNVPSHVTRNIANFLHFSKISRAMFDEVLGAEKADELFGDFLKMCSPECWDAVTLNDDDGLIRQEFHDFFGEWQLTNLG
ncbi:TPA_asm: protein 2 [Guizotia virus 1]|uniref:Protein 2 n=1 Tax=Guizotia virus 1 TaxID=2977969 RepID=A0A9N6YJ16_9RHAB|nr:TPA_asm: protein 2 [Guizotia virus 1]